MLNSVFSYVITENKADIPELPVKKEFGKYTLSLDNNTPFACAAKGEIACAIYGLAVNVITGESDNLVNQIVDTCKNVDDAVAYEKQLGGKYILLFKSGGEYYIQGDATCSIPIFYNTEGAFICSDNFNYIVNAKGYEADEAFSFIRKSGDISQAMPYDITQYKEIKQLLPNHYLEINKQTAIRFINAEAKQKEISVAEATKLAAPMIEKLLSFYQKQYKIYCPITSGRDSRVVLAFLIKSKEAFSCYTIKHPHHNESTQDITVPAELCKKVNIDHKLVEDAVVPDALKEEMDRRLGSEHYSQRTLQIAHTIQKDFGDRAIINGDIIGQVGKCSLHRDIPEIFATPAYFRCKLHNYSKGAKKQIKLWLQEIKRSGEKVNTFDLFSIENRMGRWAAQENLIYNTLGQVYLNIFNSRSIVYIWTAVARKERKLSKLHIDLIRETQGDLLEIPFEKDESMVYRISKANGATYLLSSYMKYYIEGAKFKRGRSL